MPISSGNNRTEQLLTTISPAALRKSVEKLAVPRHYQAETGNNMATAAWLVEQLQLYGYQVKIQSRYDNLLAVMPEVERRSLVLVGAHYDSVPQTPGADDNASAVAAMLTVAQIIAAQAPLTPVCFAAFNREEDGMLGSRELVSNWLLKQDFSVTHCHILEMVGYCQYEAGSQKVPPLPFVRIPDTGDFLGIVGNSRSKALVDSVLTNARTYVPDFPVIGLKVYFGLERFFPILKRSDHAPFWEYGIPALMWTDTAEFRNPHYHQPSDTPDTLDYKFLRQTTQLLLASVLHA
jgi:Zn-dependent M28 family amino/carboxypeptidase